MKKIIYITIALLLAGEMFANGLMMPKEKNYPKDFLKNRVTEVEVIIHGQIAETILYQEFENEYYDSVDVVYSFPLPENAKATLFRYWYKGKRYKAVLKEKQQATNPGTGEGGVAAEVNKYIGKNGIKISLKGVQANSVQKVELHYISQLEYYAGKYNYEFPLRTDRFTKNQLDQLRFDIKINSNSKIKNVSSASHSELKEVVSSDNYRQLRILQPKAYLNRDFSLSYEIEQNEMAVDFYSVNGDSTEEGHFTLFVRPQTNSTPSEQLPKRAIFLLGRMYGIQKENAITGISNSLDNLNENDYFNVVAYDYETKSWKDSVVKATTTNIEAAKTFLSTLYISYGANLDTALYKCLDMMKNDEYDNSILLFESGRPSVEPEQISIANKYNAGIFPIAFGEEVSRESMEMLAGMNYGFVTYIGAEDNIYDKINKVVSQINKPVMKKVAMEYGKADLSDLIPAKAPSLYAGSSFFTAGKYRNSGNSSLAIAGKTVNGTEAMNFNLNFTEKTDTNNFAKYLWAKEKIAAMEREILVNNSQEELKDSLVAISLKYNIRCMFTAYIADYKEEDPGPTSVDNELKGLIPETYIAGNYPNPFNPTTTIRFYINSFDAGKVKLLKIYNILGELVTVIDLSAYGEGWHNVSFNGRDYFGNILSSGIYLAQLQIGNEIRNTIKMNLLK